MLLARQPRGQQRGTLVGPTVQAVATGVSDLNGPSAGHSRLPLRLTLGSQSLAISQGLGVLAEVIALQYTSHVFVDTNRFGGLRIRHHKIALLIQYIQAERRLARGRQHEGGADG